MMRRTNKSPHFSSSASLRWPSACANQSILCRSCPRPVSRTTELPGELQPFLSVSLHAKVPGYVERVLVDRGSAVKQGNFWPN